MSPRLNGSGTPLSFGVPGTFSGLLGGVLNGDILSSIDVRWDDGSGARVFELGASWPGEIPGFRRGILGFSALFTGGGTEVLFPVCPVRWLTGVVRLVSMDTECDWLSSGVVGRVEVREDDGGLLEGSFDVA